MLRRLAPSIFLVASLGCGAPSAGNDGGSSGGGTGDLGGGQGGSGGGGSSLGGGQGGSGGGSSSLGGGQGGSGGGSAGGGTGSSDGGTRTIAFEFKNSCPAITPCGGNPVGKWNLSAACFALSAFDAGCPGVTYDFSGTGSGSMELTTSSVSQEIWWAVTGTILVPQSCARTSTLPCEVITLGIKAMGLSTKCTILGSSCSCPVSFTGGGVASSDAGASGTSFSLSDPTGTTRTYGYCIQNGNLSFQQSPGANQTDSSAFTFRP